jgi:hypothetical protein
MDLSEIQTAEDSRFKIIDGEQRACLTYASRGDQLLRLHMIVALLIIRSRRATKRAAAGIRQSREPQRRRGRSIEPDRVVHEGIVQDRLETPRRKGIGADPV